MKTRDLILLGAAAAGAYFVYRYTQNVERQAKSLGDMLKGVANAPKEFVQTVAGAESQVANQLAAGAKEVATVVTGGASQTTEQARDVGLDLARKLYDAYQYDKSGQAMKDLYDWMTGQSSKLSKNDAAKRDADLRAKEQASNAARGDYVMSPDMYTRQRGGELVVFGTDVSKSLAGGYGRALTMLGDSPPASLSKTDRKQQTINQGPQATAYKKVPTGYYERFSGGRFSLVKF